MRRGARSLATTARGDAPGCAVRMVPNMAAIPLGARGQASRAAATRVSPASVAPTFPMRRSDEPASTLTRLSRGEAIMWRRSGMRSATLSSAGTSIAEAATRLSQRLTCIYTDNTRIYSRVKFPLEAAAFALSLRAAGSIRGDARSARPSFRRRSADAEAIAGAKPMRSAGNRSSRSSRLPGTGTGARTDTLR